MAVLDRGRSERGVYEPSTLTLLRRLVNTKELNVPLTCGGLQASRLAWLHDDTYVFASHTNLYSCALSAALPRQDEYYNNQSAVSQPDLDTVSDGSGGSEQVQYTALTDDYIVPTTAHVHSTSLLTCHSTHRLEIQSVAASGRRIGSVDAAGRAIVSCATETNEGASNVVTAAPADALRAPPGWAGISLGSAALFAVSRTHANSVTVFDGPVAVFHTNTQASPAGVVITPDSGQVVTAEGPSIALYDTRDCAATRKPSITRRVCDGAVALRAICGTDTGVILGAGGDRSILALDSSTLSPRGRWCPCLKYEPAAVVPGPPTAPTCAAAASVDNEVSLGVWDGDAINGMPRSKMLSGANAVAGGRQRVCGFRADVRIVGLTRSDSGTIAAMSESGAIYTLSER